VKKNSEKKNSKLLKAGIIAVAVIVIIALVYVFALAPQQNNNGTVNSSSFASRQAYFEEAFKPKRNEYKLFEQAAVFLKKPVSEIPAFFSLKSEQEIFSSLPPVPKDFSETAYLLASGKYFSIGYLEEGYYKQPEFYPNFKEYGLRYWSKPDPKYWVTNGYGSYPAEQWDALKIGEREEFNAIVFFYSSYGVQAFQGVTLMPDSKSRENFDITITPQNFLLEPTFPKFYNGWAHKIEIQGKLKPSAKAGNYTIGINVEVPPRELREKWEFEHKNLYFDAVSGFKPEGNQIQLNITVE
jgi:hypothetical protein